MSRWVNIMMNDDAWRVVEKLPRGARSRAVSAAILNWSHAAARREASSRMAALRAQLPVGGTDEIVRSIREE